MIYHDYWVLSIEDKKQVEQLKISGLDQTQLERFVRENEFIDVNGQSACPGLKRLDLSNTNLSVLSPADLTRLAKGISLLGNLEELVLNNCGLLTNHWRQNSIWNLFNIKNFRILRLQGNSLGVLGKWGPLADILKNTHIEILDLRDNRLEIRSKNDLTSTGFFNALKKIRENGFFNEVLWESSDVNHSESEDYKNIRQEIKKQMLSYLPTYHNAPVLPIMGITLNSVLGSIGDIATECEKHFSRLSFFQRVTPIQPTLGVIAETADVAALDTKPEKIKPVARVSLRNSLIYIMSAFTSTSSQKVLPVNQDEETAVNSAPILV